MQENEPSVIIKKLKFTPSYFNLIAPISLLHLRSFQGLGLFQLERKLCRGRKNRSYIKKRKGSSIQGRSKLFLRNKLTLATSKIFVLVRIMRRRESISVLEYYNNVETCMMFYLLIVWLNPKRILCFDWLPERQGKAHLSRSGFPALVPQEKSSLFGHTVYYLLTKLFWSGQLDIGPFFLFLFLFLLISTFYPSTKVQK